MAAIVVLFIENCDDARDFVRSVKEEGTIMWAGLDTIGGVANDYEETDAEVLAASFAKKKEQEEGSEWLAM